jgi:hypothetical protein
VLRGETVESVASDGRMVLTVDQRKNSHVAWFARLRGR